MAYAQYQSYPIHRSTPSIAIPPASAYELLSEYISASEHKPWLLPNARLEATGPIAGSAQGGGVVMHGLRRVARGLNGEVMSAEESTDLDIEMGDGHLGNELHGSNDAAGSMEADPGLDVTVALGLGEADTADDVGAQVDDAPGTDWQDLDTYQLQQEDVDGDVVSETEMEGGHAVDEVELLGDNVENAEAPTKDPISKEERRRRRQEKKERRQKKAEGTTKRTQHDTDGAKSEQHEFASSKSAHEVSIIEHGVGDRDMNQTPARDAAKSGPRSNGDAAPNEENLIVNGHPEVGDVSIGAKHPRQKGKRNLSNGSLADAIAPATKKARITHQSGDGAGANDHSEKAARASKKKKDPHKEKRKHIVDAARDGGRHG